MEPRDREIVATLKERIAAEAPNRVGRMIVFGSRVRGTASPDSDLDVIALVQTRTPDLEQRLEDIAYAVMWDFDFRPIVSLKVLSESELSSAFAKGFTFYRNVMREGITV